MYLFVLFFRDMELLWPRITSTVGVCGWPRVYSEGVRRWGEEEKEEEEEEEEEEEGEEEENLWVMRRKGCYSEKEKWREGGLYYM